LRGAGAIGQSLDAFNHWGHVPVAGIRCPAWFPEQCSHRRVECDLCKLLTARVQSRDVRGHQKPLDAFWIKDFFDRLIDPRLADHQELVQRSLALHYPLGVPRL
jgi:hypothetical protein